MNRKKIQVRKHLKGQGHGENFSKSTGTLGNVTIGHAFDLFSCLLVLWVLESRQPEIFISPPQEVATQKKKIVYDSVCRSGKAVSSAKSEMSLGYGLILKVEPLQQPMGWFCLAFSIHTRHPLCPRNRWGFLGGVGRCRWCRRRKYLQ